MLLDIPQRYSAVGNAPVAPAHTARSEGRM